MTLSEPRAVVLWVLVIESLREGNLEDAVRIISTIQADVEGDPPNLIPFLELSAYALMALSPSEDDLTSQVEKQFGLFLRERLGIPCDTDTFRAVLRHPAGPIEDLPPGLGLNGALYVSLAMLAVVAQRDSRPAPAVEFAKAALNMKYEVPGAQ